MMTGNGGGETLPVDSPNNKNWLEVKYVSKNNNDDSVILDQCLANMNRDVEFILQMDPHAGVALLVGGGPSLKDTLPKLRFHKERGGHIYATNGTHDWLIARGIVPDFMILLDSREESAQFVAKPHKDCTYLLAAQCHDKAWDNLKDHHVIQWVNWVPGIDEKLPQDKPICCIGGGTTVGLKGMCLLHTWGYRKIHLFGFDSCYKDDQNHAYAQPLNDGEAVVEILCEGREFKAAKWMVKQAELFQENARLLMSMGADITVHGDGLIPHIAQQWRQEKC